MMNPTNTSKPARLNATQYTPFVRIAGATTAMTNIKPIAQTGRNHPSRRTAAESDASGDADLAGNIF